MEHKHNKSLKYIGYGFGQLDYYCEGTPDACYKCFESVKIEDMNDDEKKRVGLLVGELFDGIEGLS